MPVISISLFEGKIIEDKVRICRAIQRVFKSAFKIEHDNFHFRINEYAGSDMIIPAMSSQNYLIIEIDFMPGKLISEKNIFYENIKEELHGLKIHEDDVLVILREPSSENWYIRGETV
jgi:phenylpyruvate tautomerase PptA (4-oxalocrotonate tautomerase family)